MLAVREVFHLHENGSLASARSLIEKDLLNSSHTQRLYESVDGAALKLFSVSWEFCASMRSPYGIPGNEFKMFAKLRTYKLSDQSQSRPTRPDSCRACDMPSETLAHFIQNWPRTHGGRLPRHEHVVKKIADGLTVKVFSVVSEYLYGFRNGNLKPSPRTVMMRLIGNPLSWTHKSSQQHNRDKLARRKTPFKKAKKSPNIARTSLTEGFGTKIMSLTKYLVVLIRELSCTRSTKCANSGFPLL